MYKKVSIFVGFLFFLSSMAWADHPMPWKTVAEMEPDVQQTGLAVCPNGLVSAATLSRNGIDYALYATEGLIIIAVYHRPEPGVWPDRVWSIRVVDGRLVRVKDEPFTNQNPCDWVAHLDA